MAATGTAKVRAYATHSPSTGVLSVFLLNKDTVARATTVTLAHYTAPPSAERRVFTGSGPDDTSPTWTRQSEVTVSAGQLALTLAPVTVTVLSMTPQDTPPAAPTGLSVRPIP